MRAVVRTCDKNNSASTHYIAEVPLKGVTATFTNVMEIVPRRFYALIVKATANLE